MKYYVLYNAIMEKYLRHPRIGLWYTDKKEEAEDMLIAAKQCVTAEGLDFLNKGITILEMSEESIKEIL